MGAVHFKTKQRITLREHMMYAHTKEKGVKCPNPECREMFTRKQNAQRHFESNHTGTPRTSREKPTENRMEKVLQRGGIEYKPQAYLYPDGHDPDNKWRVVDFWLHPTRAKQDGKLFLQNGKLDSDLNACISWAGVTNSMGCRRKGALWSRRR